MRLWARVALIGALLPPLAIEASQDASAPGAVLAGIVVDAENGAPIPNAVVVTRGQRPLTTRSGPDGRWTLGGLSPGTYSAVARAAGYVPGAAEAPPANGAPRGPEGIGSALVVSAGQRRDGLRAALRRAGRVSGRVTNPAGMPVPDAEMMVEGDVSVPYVRLPVTDADGRYTLDAGVGERILIVLPNRTPSSRAPDRGWRRVFYPGTLTRPEARTVTVRAGEHLDDVDIIVPLPSAHTVTGQLVSPGGAADVRVQLVSNRGRTLRALQLDASDGTLRAEAIDAGPYVVWARAMDGDTTLAAWQTTEVAGDTDLPSMVLAPTGTIRGRVRAEPGRPAPTGSMLVGSVLSVGGEGIEILGEREVPVAPDGSFELAGVMGPRRLVVRGLPTGWDLLDVRLGAASVITAGVDVSSGAVIDDVELVIGPRR